EVADRVSEGMPVHGECAGLLYLGASLAGREGPEHPMAGALPLTGRVGPRLTLGYRDAVALTDSVLYRVGERVAGHEVHRTAGAAGANAVGSAWEGRDASGARVDEWYVTGAVHASYLHAHPAGYPQAVVRLVDAARYWDRSRSARGDSGGAG